MAELKQELTSELGLEVKIIEGKTYEELVEIARQNNEARRLALLEQEEEAIRLELLKQEEDKQETNE